jgi:hypothetical protein
MLEAVWADLDPLDSDWAGRALSVSLAQRNRCSTYLSKLIASMYHLPTEPFLRLLAVLHRRKSVWSAHCAALTRGYNK